MLEGVSLDASMVQDSFEEDEDDEGGHGKGNVHEDDGGKRRHLLLIGPVKLALRRILGLTALMVQQLHGEDPEASGEGGGEEEHEEFGNGEIGKTTESRSRFAGIYVVQEAARNLWWSRRCWR